MILSLCLTLFLSYLPLPHKFYKDNNPTMTITTLTIPQWNDIIPLDV